MPFGQMVNIGTKAVCYSMFKSINKTYLFARKQKIFLQAYQASEYLIKSLP